MLVYFLNRNQNNTYDLSNLFEKNRGMNNGVGIKRVYCFVQVQFGLKNREFFYFRCNKILDKFIVNRQ